ncbi:predicted protein [Uncinocarpus reesii 1704]|uniref:FAD-binding PCMH-type domain-containing protein n=1 Tax=Uncinocarpus reesii (strain UAMH 1704) TaxID=336963 RepID=C4JP40_UNCRE|nr:uncharacterized protein UREG_03099 [Uncinocarpus reesii 1704]EEP78254.1 predicted protein [Uncinocarpus reesii 1704]
MSRKAQCPFAVRSGGHSTTPGSSNIEDGIVIDLRGFNEVELSRDKKIAVVGSGAKWAEVYQFLDQHKLTVIGGRDPHVGVGGLTVGGGISFVSSFGGFACDNVLKYHIMMADGQILKVTHQSHPLLYFALRGGGNNFGIVLHFEFQTYSLGDFWGGRLMYRPEANEAISRGLALYNERAPEDPNLAIITTFGTRAGNPFNNVFFHYSKPIAYPPIFNETFKDLLEFEPVMNRLRIASMSNHTTELGAGGMTGNYNQLFLTLTIKNNAEIQDRMTAILAEETKKAETQIFQSIASFQPLTTPISSHFSKKGGNALNVSPNDGPLIGKFHISTLCWEAKFHA